MRAKMAGWAILLAMATTGAWTALAGGQERGAPTAAFEFSPPSPHRHQAVTFDASASSDADGRIVDYRWDLDGDGRPEKATGAEPTVTHAFADAGEHEVRVFVQDDTGNTDSAARTLTVRDAPPAASFTATPNPAKPGETVTFDASGSSDDAGVARYAWDLDGDGSLETTTGPVVQHRYPTEGEHSVLLRVYDEAGQPSDSTVVVRVARGDAAAPTPAPVPTAGFAVPQGMRPGAVVTFDASESTGEGLRYSWDFGGAAVDAGAARTVRHGFAVAGDYRVRLTVTDSSGRTAGAEHVVHVYGEPDAALTYAPAFPQAGQKVRFTLGSDAEPQDPVRFHLWDFDDGKESKDSLQGLRFPGLHPTAGPKAEHTFDKPGIHTVVAKSVTRSGQITQITKRIRVVGNLPRARGSAARADSLPGARAAQAKGQSAQKVMKTIVAEGYENEAGPGMESSAQPHIGEPVEIGMAMPQFCLPTKHFGHKSPLDDVAAKVAGAMNTNPMNPETTIPAEGPLAGKPTAHAAATQTTTCVSAGTFRVVAMDWGDQKSEKPPLSEPAADEMVKERTLWHTYAKKGTYKVVATVELKLKDITGTKGTKTMKVSQTLEVLDAYCGLLEVQGLKAAVSGGEAGVSGETPHCWIKSALGYQPSTGQLSLAGLTVRAKTADGFVWAQGNEPGQPVEAGNGTITAGPGDKLELLAGEQTLGEAPSLAIPAGQVKTLAGMVNKPLVVSGLKSAGGDIILSDGEAAKTILNLELPADFSPAGGLPSTITTGAMDAKSVLEPLGVIPATAPTELTFGQLTIPGLSLTHDHRGWHGGLKLELGAGLPTVDAAWETNPDGAPVSGVGIFDGGGFFLGADVDFGTARPSFLNLLAVQSIGFGAQTKPTVLTGRVKLVAVQKSLFSIDATLAMVWPEMSGEPVAFCNGTFHDTAVDGAAKPWTMRLCGEATLLHELKLGSAYIQLDDTGLVMFGGGLHYEILDDLLTADLTLAGSYSDPEKWQAHAHGQITENLITGESISGDLWVTPKGVAACVDLALADVGGYVQWDPFTADYFLKSCGARAPQKIGVMSSWPAVSALASQAGVTTADVKTGKDEPWHTIVVRGDGAPPKVKVKGPGGRTYTDTGARIQCVHPKTGKTMTMCTAKTRHNGIMRSESTDTTIVYLGKPPKGNWKVTAQADSAPIKSIAHAEGMAEPKLGVKVTNASGKAGLKVKGAGGKVDLEVKGAIPPGMDVLFTETDATGKSASIAPLPKATSSAATARARRTARRRFRPAVGLARKRRIVANVSVDGIPWKTFTVGRYTAPRPVVPKPPRRARARVTPKGLLVTFTPGRGAARHLVVAATGGGRTFSVEVPRRRRSVLLRGYRPQDGARVGVFTVTATGSRLTRPARARVKPRAPRPMVVGTL